MAENEMERAAAEWLALIAAGPLPPERLAAFEEWLADPRHEMAVARLIIAELDAEFLGGTAHRKAPHEK
jgi:ferric-dicitrate binding protein FerR (iron transport regulator)